MRGPRKSLTRRSGPKTNSDFEGLAVTLPGTRLAAHSPAPGRLSFPPPAEPRKEFHMQVRDIMTRHMAFCMPEKSLDEVARMMVTCDCGAIPVVDQITGRAVGIVTD